MSKVERSMEELYADDPERADAAVFGRETGVNRRGDEATPPAFRPCGPGARMHVCPLTYCGGRVGWPCTARAIEAVPCIAGRLAAITVASKRAHPAAQGPASRALLRAPLPISGAGRKPVP